MCNYRCIFQIIKRTITRLAYAYLLICAVVVTLPAGSAKSRSLDNTILSLPVSHDRSAGLETQSLFSFSCSCERHSLSGISIRFKDQLQTKGSGDLTSQANVRYGKQDYQMSIAKEGDSEWANGIVTDYPLSVATFSNPRRSVMEPSERQIKITVKGKVLDEHGVTVPGVNILEKGTSNGTTTDANGEYSIEVGDGAVLIFSSIGFATQEIPVAGKATIDVKLQPDVRKLDEVVVVGYGEQKKVSLTSAVTNINTSEMVNVPTANLSNVLAGRASGTYVQTGTGLPGKTSVMRIRSSSSWNSTGPLIVVDGIQRDQVYFDSLDPNQIADIAILKDAASAAIYGARSSDGVLLVTTKQGRKGKAEVQYNAVFGMYSEPAISPKFLPMDKAIDNFNMTNDTGGKYNGYDREWIRKNNPDGKIHFNEAYINPDNQRHALNVSGGDEKVTYFIAGNYYKEKGILPQVNFQRYNIRSNVDVNLSKALKLGLNLNYFNSNRHRFYVQEGKDDDMSGYFMKLYYTMSPLQPTYIDGKAAKPKPAWVSNPIHLMKNGGYLRARKQYIDALISLEYKVPFIKGLKVKSVVNLYGEDDLTKSFAKKIKVHNFKPDPLSGIGLIPTNIETGSELSADPKQEFIGKENGKTTSYQVDMILSYDTILGDHHLGLVGVFEQLQGEYAYTTLYKYNFPYNTTDQMAFSSQVSGDTKADDYESYLNARRSYVGRLQYDYREKYLFSASLRADGSFKFTKSNRWGYFPAASVGWAVSKENFLKNSGALELLKFRASYGSTGNDNVPAWMYRELYTRSDNPYHLGSPGSNQSVLLYNGLAQTNYTWESAESYNVGMDLRLFGHWNFTADFWTKSTYNILGQLILQTPVEFGSPYPVENKGKMDAKGLELELGYTDGKIGHDFTFDVRGFVGLATTLVKAKDAPLGATKAEDPVGKPLNYAVGYKDIGILRTDNDLTALPKGYTIFGAAPIKGMMNFQDVSGPEGKPDNRIDDYDKVVVADYSNVPVVSALTNLNQSNPSQTTVTTQQSNNAPISFGLTLNMRYKQFSINALVSGLAGYKIIYNDAFSRKAQGVIPGFAYYDDSYTETNTNGSFPMLYRTSQSHLDRRDYSEVSGLNTFPGTFVRLKFLNIAYNFPEPVLKVCRLKGAQFFAGGTNLFTWSKFDLYDPELFNHDSYPVMSAYTLGFNVQF